MVKVVAINGSPRKNSNTAKLLHNALTGAVSVGATGDLIHLIDLNYKGCVSCFSCHRKETKCQGTCALNDELTPVLSKAMESDVLILGSPIYLGDVTSLMRSFLERFVFMNHTYDEPSLSTFSGSLAGAFIYSMGASAAIAKQEYNRVFETNTNLLKRFHGRVEQLIVTDTYQFSDYANYATSLIDVEQKKFIKDHQFPIDCEKAFNLGKQLASHK